MKNVQSPEEVHLSDFQKGKSSIARILPLSLALFIGYSLHFLSEFVILYPPMVSFSLTGDSVYLILKFVTIALKSLLLPIVIYMVKEKLQLALIWAGINLNLSFLMLRMRLIFADSGFEENYLSMIIYAVFEGFMLAGVIVFLIQYSKTPLHMYLAILAYKVSLFVLNTLLGKGIFSFFSLGTVFDLVLLLIYSGIFFVCLYVGLAVQKKKPRSSVKV